jgi:DNA polymerase-1
MQVHDELVLEVAETAVERVREAVRTAMIAAGGDALKVPLKVDIGVGRNWDEAH